VRTKLLSINPDVPEIHGNQLPSIR
jgi:hypothetical protein